MAAENPCIRCGACCATYRVSFYWAETDAAPGGTVPTALTDKLTPQLAVMRGTDCPEPRCVALEGTIGGEIRCGIYAQRPTPCRELQPAWADGLPSEQCDRARIRHGLPPLPRDYFTAGRDG